MLQQVGEALRAFGGVARKSCRDGTRDLSQLAFDRRSETTGAAAHQGVQARDRSVEPSHGGDQRVHPLAVVLEADHLSHADIMNPVTDTLPLGLQRSGQPRHLPR